LLLDSLVWEQLFGRLPVFGHVVGIEATAGQK
jgi:hypothetical protein